MITNPRNREEWITMLQVAGMLIGLSIGVPAVIAGVFYGIGGIWLGYR